MQIQILTKPIIVSEVRMLAESGYGLLINGCVDVARKKLRLVGIIHEWMKFLCPRSRLGQHLAREFYTYKNGR